MQCDRKREDELARIFPIFDDKSSALLFDVEDFSASVFESLVDGNTNPCGFFQLIVYNTVLK